MLTSNVLVGSVTTLVVVVAVFLAYNANQGLPFVPTRVLHVEMQNGRELLRGNEVREGGTRIGIVDQLRPAELPGGGVGAVATLKLDEQVGALPVDSTATIRTRSALGLEYLDIRRGRSGRTIPDGGTIPVSQTQQPVELDQVFSIFDRPTRRAVAGNIKELGDALAGRGADLNAAIRDLPRTLGLLAPVAANLADARTGLANLVPALERTAGVLAPVGGRLARTFTSLADTFAAISHDPRALGDTIDKTPGTLAVGTRSLAVQVPFLRETAAFARDLDTATIELRRALPDLNAALRAAIPVTRRSSGLYRDLQATMAALLDLVRTPTTNAALRGLTATVTTLQPQLRFLGPFVTVCNYWNIWWTFISEHLSAPTPQGTAQRAMLDLATLQNNTYSVAGAVAPANGEGVIGGGPPVYLHNQPYNHAVNPAGQADCTAGQSGVVQRLYKNGQPRFKIAVDAIAPNQFGYPLGPTYKTFGPDGGQGLGPSAVPAGETFTALPGGIAAQVP
ncbi:MAG: phospholipid/cholesterol/gamma-HCH transport system substrate-binding protein [Solirubrobacteraceae bacterium]|nr:phospholipid/cholesterol/gamma-HCH transport system substrate-binding protein [Solirubrobacteraceae bacterium]